MTGRAIEVADNGGRPDPHFQPGAFITADNSGDHRGVMVEEDANIQLTGADAGPG